MAFQLRISRKLQPTKPANLPDLFAGNGRLLAAAELHPPGHEQVAPPRRRRIQSELIDGGPPTLRFLRNPFSRSSLHRALYQIPFVLPHPPSLAHVQKGLPLVYRSIKYSPYSVVNSLPSDSVADDSKSEIDRKELDDVCKVIDETFALDRNMEAVLDECGIDLRHELVLGVLERFKQARKPVFRFFLWAAERPVFDHDSRTYNAMMSILGKARQFETMSSVLEEMGDKGLLGTETFVVCIKAFASAKEGRRAVRVFELMRKYNFRVEVEMVNCLLDALGRAKLAKEAQALFERLEQSDKFAPNLNTHTILLNGWCRVKNLMEAGRVWNGMIDNGFKPDVVAHNTMLEGLLRSQKKPDAVKLFEVMKSKGPPPNVRSYTVIINHLCKHGDMDEAVGYFDDMQNSGCEPDAGVYTCLMTGFGNKRKMDKVYRLLNEMREKGCPPDGQTYNALIKMMANRQMPDDAVRVYKKMRGSGNRPSIHSYNMIMKSYFVARDWEMGQEVWEEMKREGVCPDENSYIVLIGGLLRLGRSVEACGYLEEMVGKGMKAPGMDYKKMMAKGKMGLAGKAEVAEMFTRWMTKTS